MDIDPFKTGDLWTYSGGAGAFLVFCRFIFKLLRKDIRDLNDLHANDEVIKNWKDMAESFKASSKEHALRADLFADQRNKAIEELGLLKGEVKALTSQIYRLEENLDRMEIALTAMEERIANTLCPHCNNPIN